MNDEDLPGLRLPPRATRATQGEGVSFRIVSTTMGTIGPLCATFVRFSTVLRVSDVLDCFRG